MTQPPPRQRAYGLCPARASAAPRHARRVSAVLFFRFGHDIRKQGSGVG
ncbi:MAG: hypothetical protein LC789_14500 [Actinobacteria bacterium]|nr:hypothetical protein [Actinomycetota bacterium]MCA1721317.1 hypothetical protein [Actinomycetota bacterium]